MDPVTWIYIAILVVSAILQHAMRPKQQEPKPVAFEEIDFPQFEEGTRQCVIFGDVWIPDWIVLSVGRYRTRAIRSKTGK